MDKWQQFLELQAEIYKILYAISVLVWDQQTYMPSGGVEARSESLAYLQTLLHSKATAPETKALFENLEQLTNDPDKGVFVRAAKREYDLAIKIPTSLVEESSKVTSIAMAKWQEAKAKDDFSIFEPYLEKVFGIAIKKAEAYGFRNEPYDALLNIYEPGMNTAEVSAIFSALKDELVPLVKEVVSRNKERPVLFDQDFSQNGQWDLGVKVLKEMGFDFTYGRQDQSEHPFTINFDPTDVRITTKIHSRSFPSSLYSSMHEGGHALYEMGIPIEWRHLAVGKAASTAMHESQSRMWENIVGRSREYLSHLWPLVKKTFPDQFKEADFEEFYTAVNWVEPSFIRTEADELTYNLHIFLRFELERDVLNGKLKVKDLPEAWNEKIKSYLGLTVSKPSLGILQDIHWSMGSVGYFPTYALGNIMAAQIYEKANQEISDLQKSISQGELLRLREWLRENVHKKGSAFYPQELLNNLTGSMLTISPYLEYLKSKYK